MVEQELSVGTSLSVHHRLPLSDRFVFFYDHPDRGLNKFERKFAPALSIKVFCFDRLPIELVRPNLSSHQFVSPRTGRRSSSIALHIRNQPALDPEESVVQIVLWLWQRASAVNTIIVPDFRHKRVRSGHAFSGVWVLQVQFRRGWRQPRFKWDTTVEDETVLFKYFEVF